MPGIRRTAKNLALVVIASLIAGSLLLASPPVQHWIGDRIEAAVGPGLRVDRVRLSLYPILGLRLEALQLFDPAQPESRSAIDIADARVAVSLGALLGGHLEIDQIIVTRLRVRIEPGPTGETTLPAALGSLADGDVEAAEIDAPATSREDDDGTPFAIPVAIRDIEVEIGRAPDEPLRIGLESLDAQIVVGDATTGTTFDIEARPGPRGRIAIVGAYGAGGVEDALEAELNVEDVPSKRFLSEALGGFEAYTMSLGMAGRLGDGATPPDLRGHGKLDFKGGKQASSNLARLIFEAFLVLLPEGDESEESNAQTRAASIDFLRADLEIADRLVTIRSLEFVSDDFLVDGSGSVSFDRATRLDLEAALTSSGVARLLVSARLPLPEMTGSLPPTPIRITGQGSTLNARPLVENLPLATVGYAADTVLGAGRGLLDRVARLFGADGAETSAEQTEPAKGEGEPAHEAKRESADEAP